MLSKPPCKIIIARRVPCVHHIFDKPCVFGINTGRCVNGIVTGNMVVTVGNALGIALGERRSEIGTSCAERGPRRIYQKVTLIGVVFQHRNRCLTVI